MLKTKNENIEWALVNESITAQIENFTVGEELEFTHHVQFKVWLVQECNCQCFVSTSNTSTKMLTHTFPMEDFFPFGNRFKVTNKKLYQFLELVNSQSTMSDFDNQLTFFLANRNDPIAIQNVRNFCGSIICRSSFHSKEHCFSICFHSLVHLYIFLCLENCYKDYCMK